MCSRRTWWNGQAPDVENKRQHLAGCRWSCWIHAVTDLVLVDRMTSSMTEAHPKVGLGRPVVCSQNKVVTSNISNGWILFLTFWRKSSICMHPVWIPRGWLHPSLPCSWTMICHIFIIDHCSRWQLSCRGNLYTSTYKPPVMKRPSAAAFGDTYETSDSEWSHSWCWPVGLS